MTNSLFTQTPLTVVLAGASGAIGSALLQQLLTQTNVKQVYVVQRTRMEFEDPRVRVIVCDITEQADLDVLSSRLSADGAAVNLLMNATGLLHDGDLKPEKALSQLQNTALQRSFMINAFAPVMLLKAVLPHFAKQIPAWVISLSAKVGSISDNRLGGWYSYRAAKAAQNQLFKTASIELKRSHPLTTCLQLHPGTVNSSLSRPFQSAVTQGKLFTPEYSAHQLLSVIANKTPVDTGTFWGWDNAHIPW